MANVRRSRAGGFIRGGVRARRETFWLGGVTTLTSFPVAATKVLLTSLNAGALALRPFTVVRTRGLLYLRSDQVVATEEQSGAYGEAVVSEQASAVGITAVPGPVSNADSELFHVFQAIATAFFFSSAAGMGVNGAGFVIDSKAMRKVEDGQDLITIYESDAAAVSAGQVVKTYSRLLVKLH